MSFLFDTSFLTCKITEVEDAGATHSTVLVDIDLLNERAGEGEYTFYAYAVSNLTDSKGFGTSASAALQDNALEVLDTLFVSFTDFVVDSNCVACFELGEILTFHEIFDVLH